MFSICPRTSRLLYAVVSIITAVSAPSLAVQYTVTDLGVTLRPEDKPTAINSSGHVVGFVGYTSTSIKARSYIYDGTQVRPLPSLGTDTDTRANGINDAGLIVGTSKTNNGANHAFLYDGTTFSDFVVGFGPHTYGKAINNLGIVAGEGNFQSTLTFRRSAAGDVTMLGSLGGGDSFAHGINGSGAVVGEAKLTDRVHAFIFDDGGPSMRDLGTFGGRNSYAYDINDAGVVVGIADKTNGQLGAFFYDATGMHELGSLGGPSLYARAINDLGQIVGDGSTSTFQPAAFIYENGVVKNLNSILVPGSGWNLTFASDINSRGQIIGTGEFNGQSHAFLLTPTPEPASIAGIALTITGLLARGRRS